MSGSEQGNPIGWRWSSETSGSRAGWPPKSGLVPQTRWEPGRRLPVAGVLLAAAPGGRAPPRSPPAAGTCPHLDSVHPVPGLSRTDQVERHLARPGLPPFEAALQAGYPTSRLRATAAMHASGSTPTPMRPRAAKRTAAFPVPQPTSTTLGRCSRVGHFRARFDMERTPSSSVWCPVLGLGHRDVGYPSLGLFVH